jgi:acyl-coenzyme A synthetase/AMP-(fatty) acid ligase
MAKIGDPERTSFWHRMGDVGYFDDRGRLWFCGRKSHRVVTVERTLFTIPVEAIFNRHPAVFRTALVGVGKPGTTWPVLCVELRQPMDFLNQLRVQSELLRLGSARDDTAMITNFLFHPGFPVDIRHNSKIFREKLAVWAAKQLR